MLQQSNFDKFFYNEENDTGLNPHTFEKGKISGLFFHNIFEILDFTQPIDQKWLKLKLEKYHFNVKWTAIIQNWIHTIINTPLNNENFTLSKITPDNKKTEVKFYLPINTYVTPQKLNFLCKNHDPLSLRSPNLNFSKIKGMLTGIIDLIFFWNQKYYLLDYKTNWLGKNNDAYNVNNIEEEIIKQHYTLQYQLYTLALHRFLRHKITSYNYKKNFGGIYYLFIRGMNYEKYNNGVYFIQPLPLIFVEKLDNLFHGK